jgi:beta-N-acetylhexosaminidase
MTFNATAEESLKLQNSNEVERILSGMTVEEKIGQLFIFGFNEQEFTPSLRYFLKTYKPGGLIFFSRNGKDPKKVQKLIQDIKNYYKVIQKTEPFFVVDHEGGEVVRVGPPHFFPSALSLGQANDPAIAYDLGKWTGRYLKNIGFDINLAPVVDLRSESSVNFIGERSFSSDPDEVVKVVSPFISGARSAGVLSVLKHFPGHGRTIEDSHFEIVRKISSHLSVPALDPSAELTTFSKPIVSKLSDEYQHEGLVFSDDLDMLFFKNKKINIGEKSLEAFKAGHDQVLVVWSRNNQRNSLAFLKARLNDGTTDISFVDNKVRKVLATKLHLKDDRVLNYKNVVSSLNKIYNLQNQINFLHFNKLSKSVIQDISESLKQKKNVRLFTYSYHFYKAFKGNFSNGGFIPLSQANWKDAAQSCKKFLCFFHVSGDKSAQLIKQLPKNVLQEMILINTSDPAVTQNLNVKTLNLYSNSNKFWTWFAKEIEKNDDSDDNYAFKHIKRDIKIIN